MNGEGKIVDEKEWRRQNIEWERRRREAEKDAEFKHQREVDKRRARMCLRQQQREADYRKKKDKQQDLNDAVKVRSKYLVTYLPTYLLKWLAVHAQGGKLSASRVVVDLLPSTRVTVWFLFFDCCRVIWYNS